MFKKKKCSKCREKVEEGYNFCPYCGNRFETDEENNDSWGMLGKNDFFPNEVKMPLGFNALFNSLMKNLSKELDGQLSNNYFPLDNSKKTKKDGISISISTFGNGPAKIKVAPIGNMQKIVPEKEKDTEKIKQNFFTEEKIKTFSKLPREEPKTNIRRLSNMVIYELEIPGVKSAEDISIIKLENSIEIKAIAKNKAYSKIIPINLPIKKYNLSAGKLVLELGIKN